MIRPRSDWAARPSRGAAWLPDDVGVAVHWEGPHMGDYQPDAVPALLRAIQNYHMDRQGWADIAYSFVVDRYGTVWEGRGWNARSAANGTSSSNDNYLAVCYLGGQGDPFTPAAANALTRLVSEHVARGGRPELTGHRDHTPTACPGDDIYAWVHGAALAPAEEDDLPLNDNDLNQIAVRVDALIARAAGNIHAAVRNDVTAGFAGIGADMRALADAVRQTAPAPVDAADLAEKVAAAIVRQVLTKAG